MVSKRLVRLKYPHWIRGDDWGGDEDCGNKIERPFWPFVCIFVCERACMWVCMCDQVRLDVRVWRVAHKYTVQYGFRYLPPWRIYA